MHRLHLVSLPDARSHQEHNVKVLAALYQLGTILRHVPKSRAAADAPIEM